MRRKLFQSHDLVKQLSFSVGALCLFFVIISAYSQSFSFLFWGSASVCFPVISLIFSPHYPTKSTELLSVNIIFCIVDIPSDISCSLLFSRRRCVDRFQIKSCLFYIGSYGKYMTQNMYIWQCCVGISPCRFILFGSNIICNLEHCGQGCFRNCLIGLCNFSVLAD